MKTIPDIVQLQKYDTAYAKGKPLISDAKYDRLRDQAQKAYPKHPYFAKVGAPTPTKATKSKMPFTVGSLDKVRPGQALEFMQDVAKRGGNQDTWYVMPKLDGSSGLIKYHKGSLQVVWSRGDGEVGRDITTAAKYVQGVRPSLAKVDSFDYPDVCVRGEFVMHRSIFDELYALKEDSKKSESYYKHPRNLVVGLLNRIDVEGSKKDLRNVTFVALQLFVRGENGKWVRPASRHKELVLMHMFGLTTISNPSRYTDGHKKLVKLVKNGHENLRSVLPVFDIEKSIGSMFVHEKMPTAEQLISLLANYRKKVDIPMDGLVLEPGNSKRFIRDGEHLEVRPSYIRAVKLDAIDQEFAEAKIDRIEWEVSKRGLLKPTVVLREPVSFDGVEVTNITANNAAFVSAWGFDIPGARVRVTRSGDVIPKLVSRRIGKEWVPIEGRPTKHNFAINLPTKCPSCKTKLEWNKTKVDLLCPNDECSGRQAKSIVSFFSTLDADMLKSGTIQKLIDAHHDTIPKILALEEKAVLKIPGFKQTSAANLIKAIQKSLDGVSLPNLMHASNVFSTSVFSLGSTKLANAVSALDKALGSKWQEEKPSKLRAVLTKTSGFGENSADLFAKVWPEWREFYLSVQPYLTLAKGSKAKHLVAAFTGFRDTQISDLITKNGGRVSNSVSRNCTVLFAASLGSLKAQKAHKLGIEVVTASEALAYVKKIMR